MTMKIDGDTKSISCDCERYNRTGKCHWVECMEVIQFNAKVPDNYRVVDESVGWDRIVAQAK